MALRLPSLLQMRFPRSSGILLHPTSLPGVHGIGDLGPDARKFVDFLAAAGQKVWQVLPLNPTGYGESPYQCYSANAGNPLFIHVDAAAAEHLPSDCVDYERVVPYKAELLEETARRFFAAPPAPERTRFEEFCHSQAPWLDDFALFMALKKAHGGVAWSRWGFGARDRDPDAISRWRDRLRSEIATQRYLQFVFFEQWSALRDYAHNRDVRIMGDLPIYVAHDSADVWAQRSYFRLDDRGEPEVVAGVPPDYFSATGQLWGNPIYDWKELARDGYRWWIGRFRAALEMVDMIRLDHFRGFEGYWEVPAGEPTAENGRWVKGPGGELFEAVQEVLGELPLVAENLGVITPEVEAIRERFGFPGMSILQFAFGSDPQGPSFRPHNYPRNLVAYTGTHDCDTTVGWWTSRGEGDSTRTADEIQRERAFCRQYLNTDGREIHWDFIRALEASVADTVLIPLQDVLGFGSAARMNQPATVGKNWRWRYRPEMLTERLAERLRKVTETYDR
jgi:4-alpha-glucanotransferase